MPTITPQYRVQIGSSPDQAPQSPRLQIQANTVSGGVPRQSQSAPAGQPNIVEETGSKPKEVTLSPQLTALARRQQKLQAEIQALRTREAAFEAKQADYIPKSSIKQKIQDMGEDGLKELGLSYEEITQILLARQNGADPVRALEAKVDQLQKSQEEQTNKQYDATLKQYKSEADALVASDPKAFHFIAKGKHSDAVVQHIVETWEENPEIVLTVAQAAKEVEELLREHAKEQAAALQELEPKADPEQVQQPQKKTLPPPAQRIQQAAPKTLTSQMDGSPQARSFNQMQHMSMKERLQEAIRRAQRTG